MQIKQNEWNQSVTINVARKDIKKFCKTLKKNWIKKNDKNEISDENKKSLKSDKKN